jgi:hypothetical protein
MKQELYRDDKTLKMAMIKDFMRICNERRSIRFFIYNFSSSKIFNHYKMCLNDYSSFCVNKNFP